ncbi:MAG: hypothetical protein AAGJ31_14640, partial [Verrucomicrobiota bacterium]
MPSLLGAQENEEESLVPAPLVPAPERWDLSPLAPPPRWSLLDVYQETISLKTFVEELALNYEAGEGASKNLITIDEENQLARILYQNKTPDLLWTLRFAKKDQLAPKYWRAASELPPASRRDRPLEGLRIVIDPGHIGGPWADMEQRRFLIYPPGSKEPGEVTELLPPHGPFRPVMEGSIVLRVAEILEEKLTALGAYVALARRQTEPVTPQRPNDFADLARSSLGYSSRIQMSENSNLRRKAERLFYLSAEIRARGTRVNESFRPDLALCLHLNAEAWGSPSRPSFSTKNHLHFLINGCYSRSEILKDDQRFEMILRLLQRIHPEELAVCRT